MRSPTFPSRVKLAWSSSMWRSGSGQFFPRLCPLTPLTRLASYCWSFTSPSNHSPNENGICRRCSHSLSSTGTQIQVPKVTELIMYEIKFRIRFRLENPINVISVHVYTGTYSSLHLENNRYKVHVVHTI